MKISIDGKRVDIKTFIESKNLTVKGDLDLSGTGITALPEGLSVGGSLYLDPCTISFPRAGRMRIGWPGSPRRELRTTSHGLAPCPCASTWAAPGPQARPRPWTAFAAHPPSTVTSTP